MRQRIECKLCGEDWPVTPENAGWTAEDLKYHATTHHPETPWWSLTTEES